LNAPRTPDFQYHLRTPGQGPKKEDVSGETWTYGNPKAVRYGNSIIFCFTLLVTEAKQYALQGGVRVVDLRARSLARVVDFPARSFDSMCMVSILSFTRWCRDIIQVRWKMFTFIVANLFRKLCTKFHKNRSSFIENITKNNLVSFSWTYCILMTE